MCKLLGSFEPSKPFTMLLSFPGMQACIWVARGAGGRAVLGSGLLFRLLPGAALSNNLVTSHTELSKFKAENSVPHSD